MDRQWTHVQWEIQVPEVYVAFVSCLLEEQKILLPNTIPNEQSSQTLQQPNSRSCDLNYIFVTAQITGKNCRYLCRESSVIDFIYFMARLKDLKQNTSGKTDKSARDYI